MSGDADEIILEVECTPITCKKQELTKNSDYFKAMLEGNFVESNKQSIKLEGVNLKSMQIVLQYLSNENLEIENQDLLPVLETVCMLQFLKLREHCISTLTDFLEPKDCLEVWIVCEKLEIKPLYLQAKTMSLMEFSDIKDSEFILSFTLEQLCNYLGNRHLQCNREIDVLETALKWWYENYTHYQENANEVILKLISCLDFSRLSVNDVSQIKNYPDILNKPEILDAIDYIEAIKKGAHDVPAVVDASVKETAVYLLNSKPRFDPTCPCIIVEQMGRDSSVTVFNQEEYMPRKFQKLATLYFDFRTSSFHEIADDACPPNLEGFRLVGYKHYIFLLGGEFGIGRGGWNHNFWAYDSITETSDFRAPFNSRRHFQCCIVDEILYVLGGTGSFRVIQDTLLWYDINTGVWSKEERLPCDKRQFKAFSFKNKLFILCMNTKTCFSLKHLPTLYGTRTTQWEKVHIIDPDDFGMPGLVENFTIFTYRDKIYIKGTELIELNLLDKKTLRVVAIKRLNIRPYDDVQAVLCNDILYSIYTRRITYENKNVMSFETFNVVTHEIGVFFSDMYEDSELIVSDKCYKLTDKFLLFPFYHFSLNEKNDLVHDIHF